MIAAARGDLDKVKFLIENNADVNAKTELGFTVIWGAKNYKHWEIANYLRAHGAKD